MSYQSPVPRDPRHSKMFKLIQEAEEQARLCATAPCQEDVQDVVSEKIKAQNIASLRPMSTLQSVKRTQGRNMLKWPRLRSI